jgi:hypothetical protein
MQLDRHGLALVPVPPPLAVQVPSAAGLRNVRDTLTTRDVAAPPHVTPYTVDVVGETEITPETAPPVEKPVPVQEAAPLESQVNSAVPPLGMVAPAKPFSELTADR